MPANFNPQEFLGVDILLVLVYSKAQEVKAMVFRTEQGEVFKVGEYKAEARHWGGEVSISAIYIESSFGEIEATRIQSNDPNDAIMAEKVVESVLAAFAEASSRVEHGVFDFGEEVAKARMSVV